MTNIDLNPAHSPYFTTIAGGIQSVTGIPVAGIAAGIFGGAATPNPTGSYAAPAQAAPPPAQPPGTAPSLFGTFAAPNWTTIAILFGVLVLLWYFFLRRKH